MTETDVRLDPNVEYGDPEVAKQNEILRTVVGSGLHGIAIEGTDDHDEMGVFVEPPHYLLGVSRYRDNYIWRTQPEGARSGPGDTDLVIYGLRKFLRLAMAGNPTVLLPLFAPESDVIVQTELGQDLREHRDWFLSRQTVERFLGYMEGQRERMMGLGKQNRMPNRPELIEQFGWDVKYGAHALRLAYQGYEIAMFGRLTLPMMESMREHVLAVKRGQYTRESVNRSILELSQVTEGMLLDSSCPLPEEPPRDTIEAWSTNAHFTQWSRPSF